MSTAREMLDEVVRRFLRAEHPMVRMWSSPIPIGSSKKKYLRQKSEVFLFVCSAGQSLRSKKSSTEEQECDAVGGRGFYILAVIVYVFASPKIRSPVINVIKTACTTKLVIPFCIK